MGKKKKALIDMTQGNVGSSLIRFAIPLVAGSVFQLLYSTTDLLFVGNLVGTIAAAAVGASSMLVTCLIGIFSGIATGTSVAVSQAIGADDRKQGEDLVHTAIGFAVTAGLILMLLGEFAAPFALRLMKTPDNIFPEAVAYIRLYFLGMLPMVLYNIGSGILRACGDSQRPFYILAAGGFLNVAVDALMIGGLRMGVRGAALATTISQTFSAVAVLYLLLRGNEKLRLIPKKICVHKDSLLRILHLGLPAGIQSMLITLSNVIVQYYINSFGSDTIAAFTTYFKLENFTYLPVLAFGQAAMTFAGQNLGAGKVKRIRKGTAVAAVTSVATVAAISFFLLAIGTTALGWFGKDEKVIRIGLEIIGVSFPLYWLTSLMEVFGGTLRGMGYSLLSMIIVLCSICLGRITLLNVMVARVHNVKALISVYPITWGLTVVLLFVAMVWAWKRVEKVYGKD